MADQKKCKRGGSRIRQCRKASVQPGTSRYLGQVINVLYNMVDRMYIGHLPDVGA